MTPILEIDDLHTHFRTRDGVVRAIEGLSLTVQAGEVLGIVGESGCGKSVTALSVMRLIPASAGGIVKGQVRFEGKDLASLSEPQMRSIRGNQIAMVFQEPMTSLNPVHTVGAQIAEAAHPRCAAPRERLPAPVLGRHAPAGDDCDGPVVQPQAVDCR
ncbi:MAG: ATP-binding cassette domain-containing protein [Burkholderiales bacterium]|nr:ATP-binding cassette domain-containing protein [Burkholderiales bacterium]